MRERERVCLPHFSTALFKESDEAVVSRLDWGLGVETAQVVVDGVQSAMLRVPHTVAVTTHVHYWIHRLDDCEAKQTTGDEVDMTLCVY